MTDLAVSSAEAEELAAPRGEGRGQGLLANTGALLGSRVAMAALGWGGTVLVARHLAVEQFGQYTFVFTVLGMLAIVTDMGVGRLAIGALLHPTGDPARFAGSYIVLRCCMGVVGYGIAMAFVTVAGYPPSVVRATALAGLVVVLATPSHAYDLAFQAHLRMPQVALVNVIAMVGQLSLVAAIAVRGGSMVWFCVPAVMCEVVTLLIKVPLAHRLLAFRYVVDVRAWAAMLREAAPISAGAALATLYYKIDAVMLSKLDTFEAVGRYGIAYKFVDLVHFVPSALAITTLTLLVKAWPDDVAAFRAAFQRTLLLLATTAGIVLVSFALFAEHVTRLFYGDSFSAAGAATRVLVAGECVAYFSSVAFAALVAAGRHRRYPLITLAGLVANVAINAVAIPRYSIQGAAVATLLTEVLVAALLWRELFRVPGLRPFGVGALAPVGVATIVAALVGLGLVLVVPWWVAGCGVGLVYLGTVHVLAPGEHGLLGLLGRTSSRSEEDPR